MLGKERNTNSNKETDPFVDRAWSDMSSLLDKEMPVASKAAVAPAQKGYRIAYFLLFLLIGFVAGAGLMLLWTENQQQVPQQQQPEEQLEVLPAKKQPLAEVPPTMDDKSMLAGQYTPPAGKLEAGYGPATQSQAFKIPDSGPPDLEKKPPGSTGPPIIAVPKASETILQRNKIYDINSTLLKTNHSNKLIPSATPSSLALSSDDKKGGTTSIATVSNISQLAIPAFDPLPVLVASLEEKPFQGQFPMIPLSHPKKWQLGLNFGVLSQKLNNTSGLNAGLYVQYQLDRRFAIQTGLTYTYMSQLNNARFAQANEGAYDPIVTGPNELEDTVSVSPNIQNLPAYAADLPIYSMEYLHLPVLLTFSPQRKIRIESGLQFGWLLRTQQSSKDHRYIALPYAPENIEQGIRKLNISASMGIGFQLMSRLGLGLQYQYGMFDYTKNDFFGIRRVDAHQYWQLSMRYKLGQF